MSLSQSQTEQLKRLKFACRRGLAETEVILMAYWQHLVNQSTNDLTSGSTNEVQFRQACQLFEQLLAENDQQLFEWLLSPQQAPDEYAALIQHMRTDYLKK